MKESSTAVDDDDGNHPTEESPGSASENNSAEDVVEDVPEHQTHLPTSSQDAEELVDDATEDEAQQSATFAEKHAVLGIPVLQFIGLRLRRFGSSEQRPKATKTTSVTRAEHNRDNREHSRHDSSPYTSSWWPTNSTQRAQWWPTYAPATPYSPQQPSYGGSLGIIWKMAFIAGLFTALGVVSLLYSQWLGAKSPYSNLRSFAVSEIVNNDLRNIEELKVDELNLFAQAACVQGMSVDVVRSALRIQLQRVPKEVREEVVDSAVIEGVSTTNSFQNSTAGLGNDGKGFNYIAFWSTAFNGDYSYVSARYSTCVNKLLQRIDCDRKGAKLTITEFCFVTFCVQMRDGGRNNTTNR